MKQGNRGFTNENHFFEKCTIYPLTEGKISGRNLCIDCQGYILNY